MIHRQLAKQIAADLFTDGSGKEYARLALVPAELADNLIIYRYGSWGRAVVIDRIEQHLKSYFLTYYTSADE